MENETTASSHHASSASSTSSVSSRFRQFRAQSKMSTEVEDAEVIARATSQAMTAARSIILSGGTQATALSTAKAAAQSVLVDRSTLHSPGSRYLVRRKAKQQALVIASMALASVNNSFQQQYTSTENLNNDMISHFVSGVDLCSHRSDLSSYRSDIPSPVVDRDRFFEENRYPSSYDTRMQVFNQSPISGLPPRSPSSPQPSARATTMSGSQTTTAQSPSPGSHGTKEPPHCYIPVSAFSSAGQHLGPTQGKDKALLSLDEERNEGFAISDIAMLANVDDQRSDQPQNLKKDILDYQKKKKGSSDVDSDDYSEFKTDPSFTPKDEEDPIYYSTQKDKNKDEQKSLETSKRMAKLWEITDSQDDSLFDWWTTSGSQDSSYQDTIESATDGAGTTDGSATDGSETDGSTFDSDDKAVTVGNENTVLSDSSSIFSAITGVLFCNPSPTVQKQLLLNHEERDERERGKESTSRAVTVVSARVPPAANRSRVRSADRDELIRDLRQRDLENDYDTMDKAYHAKDRKTKSALESMEQLVLRALSAAPDTISGTATGNNNKVLCKRDGDDSPQSVHSSRVCAEVRGDSSTTSGSLETGITSRDKPFSKRVKLPTWVRSKMAPKPINTGVE